MLTLSWNIKKTFETLNDLIDGKENALIDYFGEDNWNELLIASEGNENDAMDWVKRNLKGELHGLYILLKEIKNDTKDNELVQRKLKAIGI